jgi:hypothetical protein
MKIRPPEKYLYFPTTFHSPFERAFEPSSCFFSSAPSSPRPSKVVHFLSYLHSSAPSSPRLISIRARLWALVLSPFERAFEPSSCFFSSAPSSPRPSKVVHFLSYLHSSAPSSPRLISIRARLRALVLSPFERAFEPSFYLHSSALSSPRLISISRAPSSPRLSKVVHFLSYLLWVRLRALISFELPSIK